MKGRLTVVLGSAAAGLALLMQVGSADAARRLSGLADDLVRKTKRRIARLPSHRERIRQFGWARCCTTRGTNASAIRASAKRCSPRAS